MRDSVNAGPQGSEPANGWTADVTRKPWHHQDKTAAERGYGYQWTKTRKRIKARDQGLCQPCLKAGRATPMTEVDHIKPKAQGGTDDDANLQCICTTCHAAKTAREALEGSGYRPRPRFDAQGFPIW